MPNRFEMVEFLRLRVLYLLRIFVDVGSYLLKSRANFYDLLQAEK